MNKHFKALLVSILLIEAMVVLIGCTSAPRIGGAGAPTGNTFVTVSWTPTPTPPPTLSPTTTATKTATFTPTPTASSTPTFTPTATSIPVGGGHGLIAFTNYGSLYLITVDGSSMHKLVDRSDFKGHWGVWRYAWSPSGHYIAYSGLPESGRRRDLTEVYIVDVYTGKKNLLTKTGTADSFFWSPDGNIIAFAEFSLSDNQFELFVANADGSGSTLISPKNANIYPGYSADLTTGHFS